MKRAAALDNAAALLYLFSHSLLLGSPAYSFFPQLTARQPCVRHPLRRERVLFDPVIYIYEESCARAKRIWEKISIAS